ENSCSTLQSCGTVTVRQVVSSWPLRHASGTSVAVKAQRSMSWVRTRGSVLRAALCRRRRDVSVEDAGDEDGGEAGDGTEAEREPQQPVADELRVEHGDDHRQRDQQQD